MTHQIPKNAYMHGLNGILDMWRMPLNRDAKTTYCLKALNRYLAELHPSFKLNDFDKHDRDWLLEEDRSIEDIIYYLSDWADIEYYEDKFTPKHKEVFGNYPQRTKSVLMLANASRGGIKMSTVKECIRCITDDQGINWPMSKAFSKILGSDKPSSKYGIKEHRYPMKWLIDYLIEKVFDVRHMERVLNKYHQTIWVTHEEDQRLNDAGLKFTLPPCGDRYDAVGIAV